MRDMPERPSMSHARFDATEAPGAAAARDCHVSILERMTARALTVRFSDSLCGSYGEQMWRLSKSRARSVCALSGSPIRPGDLVFKPSNQGGKLPFNRNRMMLASEVERVLAAPGDSSPL